MLLKNSLLRVNIILLSIVVIASFAVIYFITWQSLQSEIHARLRAIPASAIAGAFLSEQQIMIRQEDRILVKGRPDLPVDYFKSFVINVDGQGNPTSVSSRISIEDMTEEDYIQAAAEALVRDREMGSIRIAGRNWNYLMNTGPGSGDGSGRRGGTIVFLDAGDIHQALGRLLLSLIIVGFSVLVVLVLVSYYFAGRSIKPVAESIRKQRQFISDASHELKTPLAIINSNAEAMMADGSATVASQRKWLDRIEEESDRMNKLIESLLYLAKSEEDDHKEALPMDLSASAEMEINRVEAILFERGIRLTFRRSREEIVVRGDGEKIRQAILILLDNAVKYTDKGGEVIVETGRRRSLGILRISNTGAGISEEDLPRIFDRFYRADRSRSSAGAQGVEQAGKRTGYGLGLSIARNIVERDRGRIDVSVDQGMTVFTIGLPLDGVRGRATSPRSS